jgi:hypothetical protein
MAATPGIRDGDDVSKLFIFDTRLGPTEDTEHEKVRAGARHPRRIASFARARRRRPCRPARHALIARAAQILFYYPASATLDQKQSDVGCVYRRACAAALCGGVRRPSERALLAKNRASVRATAAEASELLHVMRCGATLPLCAPFSCSFSCTRSRTRVGPCPPVDPLPLRREQTVRGTHQFHAHL